MLFDVLNCDSAGDPGPHQRHGEAGRGRDQDPGKGVRPVRSSVRMRGTTLWGDAV